MSNGSTLVHNDTSGFFNQLDSIIEDLNEQIGILKNIDETMTTNGWKGNTSNKFNTNIGEYENSLTSLSNQLASFKEQLMQADGTVSSAYDEFSSGA